jgi:hypothetical protein
MNKVGPLILFIVTLFVGGIYWATWEGARSYLDSFVIQNEYYILMSWGWRLVPAILLVISIICLIVAGLSGKTTQGAEDY